MPINAKKITYKEKEFQTYIIWKSLPAYFRGMNRKQLSEHGFNDPLVIKIASIKSQTEFAKKFRIKDLGTLTDWNRKIEKNKLLIDSPTDHFKKQTLDVNSAMSLRPDKLLEKKIHDQHKLIALLRKENLFFKKQLKNIVDKSPKKPEKTVTPLEVAEPVIEKKNDDIFSSIKKNILKWF